MLKRQKELADDALLVYNLKDGSSVDGKIAAQQWKDNLLQIEMPKARQGTKHWEFI